MAFSGTGLASGAMSGATTGTAVNPGWGTLIGAIAGALLGGLTGKKESSSDSVGDVSGGESSLLNSGQGTIVKQPQQVVSSPQNLFQYQPSNISQAIKDMLKSSRGF